MVARGPPLAHVVVGSSPGVSHDGGQHIPPATYAYATGSLNYNGLSEGENIKNAKSSQDVFHSPQHEQW